MRVDKRDDIGKVNDVWKPSVDFMRGRVCQKRTLRTFPLVCIFYVICMFQLSKHVWSGCFSYKQGVRVLANSGVGSKSMDMESVVSGLHTEDWGPSFHLWGVLSIHWPVLCLLSEGLLFESIVQRESSPALSQNRPGQPRSTTFTWHPSRAIARAMEFWPSQTFEAPPYLESVSLK